MQSKFSTVLEIGSSKLGVMVARKSVNQTFDVKSKIEIPYDGYIQGEFVNFENFSEKVREIFEKIEYKRFNFNKKLVIGIPSEFLSLININTSKSFGKHKKINQNDIDNLMNEAVSNVFCDEIEVVSSSFVKVVLDDIVSNVENILGEKAKKIDAEISIITAKKLFIERLNKLFAELEFVSVEYVCESLIIAQKTIDKHDREEVCLFVDVGHLSTSVCFVQGKGLLLLETASLGGGIICDSLAREFRISFDKADELKKQIVASLKGEKTDNYELIIDKNIKRINLIFANQLVAREIEKIAEKILYLVNSFSTEYITYLPVYLSGCGLSKIKGGKDSLSKYINRNIKYALTSYPGLDKIENTTILSLMDYALN